MDAPPPPTLPGLTPLTYEPPRQRVRAPGAVRGLGVAAIVLGLLMVLASVISLYDVPRLLRVVGDYDAPRVLRVAGDAGLGALYWPLVADAASSVYMLGIYLWLLLVGVRLVRNDPASPRLARRWFLAAAAGLLLGLCVGWWAYTQWPPDAVAGENGFPPGADFMVLLGLTLALHAIFLGFAWMITGSPGVRWWAGRCGESVDPRAGTRFAPDPAAGPSPTQQERNEK